MSILIDDAGWGSLIQGCLIAGYREETGEFASSMVPVEMFQGKSFAQREYIYGAVEAAKAVLLELGHTPEEPIEICTGFVLDGIREHLKASGFNWRTAKITGPLQELIETRFLEELQAVGVKGIDYETMTEKQGLFFWLCAKWLKGGDLKGRALPEREKLCKTGWDTYQFWGSLPYEEAKTAAKRFKAEKRRNNFNGRN